MTAARRTAKTAAMTPAQRDAALTLAFAVIARMTSFADGVAHFTRTVTYAAVYVNPTILASGGFIDYDGKSGLAEFVKWLASEHKIILKELSIINGGPQGSNVYELQLSGTGDGLPSSISFAMGTGPGRGHFYAQGKSDQITKVLEMMHLFLSPGVEVFS
jgi:hypothetical protein